MNAAVDWQVAQAQADVFGSLTGAHDIAVDMAASRARLMRKLEGWHQERPMRDVSEEIAQMLQETQASEQ